MPVEYIRWQPFSPSVGPSNPPTIPSMITPGTGCRDFGICRMTTSNHHHAFFNMPNKADRDVQGSALCNITRPVELPSNSQCWLCHNARVRHLVYSV